MNLKLKAYYGDRVTNGDILNFNSILKNKRK